MFTHDLATWRGVRGGVKAETWDLEPGGGIWASESSPLSLASKEMTFNDLNPPWGWLEPKLLDGCIHTAGSGSHQPQLPALRICWVGEVDFEGIALLSLITPTHSESRAKSSPRGGLGLGLRLHFSGRRLINQKIHARTQGG